MEIKISSSYFDKLSMVYRAPFKLLLLLIAGFQPGEGMASELPKCDPLKMIFAPPKPFLKSEPALVRTKKIEQETWAFHEGNLVFKDGDVIQEWKPAEEVLPDPRTAAGRYAAQMNRRGVRVILNDEDLIARKNFGYFTDSGNMRVPGGETEKTKMIVLRKSQLNTPYFASTSSHEAYHANRALAREAGAAGKYDTFVTDFDGNSLKRIHSEELHTEAKDFVNDALVNHHRETIHLIKESGIKDFDKIHLDYHSIIDDGRFNAAFDSLYVGTKRLSRDYEFLYSRLPEAQISYVSGGIRVRSKTTTIDILNLPREFKLQLFQAMKESGLPQLSPELRAEAKQRVNLLMREYAAGYLKQMANESRAVLAQAANVAEAQFNAMEKGYFTAREYYKMKDDLARVGMMVREDADQFRKNIGNYLQADEVAEKLLRPKSGQPLIFYHGKNAEIIPPRKRILVSDPSQLKLEESKLTFYSLDSNRKVSTINVAASLVVPDVHTAVGQYALAMKKRGVAVLLSDEATSHTGVYAYFQGTSVITDARGVSRKQPAVILKGISKDFGGLHFSEQGHEGYHAVSFMDWVQGNASDGYDGHFVPKDVNFNPGYKVDPNLRLKGESNTVTGSQLEENLNTSYRNFNEEELNAYGKNFIQGLFKSHHRETLSAIEDAVHHLPYPNRAEALAHIRLRADQTLHQGVAEGMGTILENFTRKHAEFLNEITKSLHQNPILDVINSPFGRENGLRTVGIHSPRFKYYLKRMPWKQAEELKFLQEEFRNTRDLGELQKVATRYREAVKKYLNPILEQRMARSLSLHDSAAQLQQKVLGYLKAGSLTPQEYIDLKDESARLGKLLERRNPTE